MDNLEKNKKIRCGVTYCAWGLIVVVFIIIVVLISIYCCAENDPELKQKLNVIVDTFAPTLPYQQKIKQPQVFKDEILSIPGNCQPYSGCFFPSYMSNPVSLKSGIRHNAQDENKVWCEKSWRDCNAYQDCVDGQCKPKTLF